MNSRDIKDLHPYLATRFKQAVDEWFLKYPSKPQPFLTQTFRSNDYQNDLYEQGRSKPGKVVTNARGGQSMHNFPPSHAFDIAFKKATDEVSWDIGLFRAFAEIITPLGVDWGGNWTGGFKDYPHFQVPGMTWRDLAAGKVFETELVVSEVSPEATFTELIALVPEWFRNALNADAALRAKIKGVIIEQIKAGKI
jgi:peptidoglycan L-alanyl-D-glutamate endopeptidase CwlK